MQWTDEQLQAIEEKDKNILVSAAAGSGKTAVLVERMINKILNFGVDIDKILIVTFTSAAASEMRERILEAIYKKLELEPDNKNLQRQIVLLNKANISTIHSFCLNVIKNNFFEIGLSPDFRIAETAEIELLKMEVLNDLLEELYEANDEKLIKLTDIYSGYLGDDNLKALILNIFNYIQSTPFPTMWLEEQVEKFNMSNKNFLETEWAKILLQNYKEKIQEYVKKLEEIRDRLSKDIELQKYYLILCDDIDQLEMTIKNSDDWNVLHENALTFKMKTWPSDKKIVSELKDEAKDERGSIREKIKKLIDSMFSVDCNQATADIHAMYEVLVMLKDIILKFSERLQETKLGKGIMDFNDIEHYALKILTKKDENGEIVKSDIAKKYAEKFHEIAIDEYQDSNTVQEWILKSVSNGNNIFMVGDVKQSIYKFRQARPELFLEKYQTYKLKKDYEEGDSLKIQLFNNFRSKEKILDFVNRIFANIMSKEYGEIDYTREEYLNYKASFETIEQDDKIELLIIDDNNVDEETSEKERINDNKIGEQEESVKEKKNGKVKSNVYEVSIKEDESDEDAVEQMEKITLEAKFVAKEIKNVLKNGYKVWDKEKSCYRSATYKDIVVLLRAPNSVAPVYEREISELNIPVFSDTSVKYLDSIEIETIMNLLKIIDNPRQDIPLVTVLRSYIGGFTDNELIEIRLTDKNCPFYEAVLKANNPKIDRFFEKIRQWQFEQEYLPLDELIWKIYLDTGYFNYVSLMPNGEFRQANLKMLFEQAKQYENASFKGLYNFIRFIENLKKNSGDLSSAKLIGENDNVVRIMSIHKSKGLEFPIVFLSGTGKKFNFRDLSNDILLHQDLGLGTRYINYERKISYDTLAKEAIKVKARDEIIAEEMRVLYVALTRAKEKLFVTGIRKKPKTANINLKNCVRYIDWMEYVNSRSDFSDIVNVKYYRKTDLEKEFNVKEEEQERNIYDVLKQYELDMENEELKLIDKELNWKYKYEEDTKIESKTSVSRIAKGNIDVFRGENLAKGISIEEMNGNTSEELNLKRIDKKVSIEVPEFMKEEKMPSNAEIGTMVHEVLQKLDLRREYTIDEIRSIAQEIEEQYFMQNKIEVGACGEKAMELDDKKSKEEKKAAKSAKNETGVKSAMSAKNVKSLISETKIKAIYEFSKSDIAKRARMAEVVCTEQPFYTYIKANEIYNVNTEENILVQGIIDLYFVEEDGIVLVDYKTDNVKNELELIDRYRGQLELYKKALEQATGKRVKECYLYSIKLNKKVEVF